jgi:hypothetical protein
VNIEHTADEPPLAPQARDMQACCGRLLMRAQRTNLAGRSQAPERGHEHEHASRDFMWLDAWGYGKVVLPTLELPRRDNPMTHNAEIARAKTQFAFESSPRRACDKITFGRARSPDGNQGSRKPGQ